MGFHLGLGRWTKVSDLAGDEHLAVVDEDGQVVFERIVALEPLPPEPVYDIEVEGAHNFVAGHWLVQQDDGSWIVDDEAPAAQTEAKSWRLGADVSSLQPPASSPRRIFGGIIAHNTYLSSNVGIGTTNPAVAKLQVAGDAAVRKGDKLLLDADDATADTYVMRNSGSTTVDWVVDGVILATLKKQTEQR